MRIKNFKVIADNITNTGQATKGKKIYYLCTACGEAIPSIPADNVGCKCGNVFIDIDYFRLVIRDYKHFKVVEITRTQ
jgi:hypothetical protein